MITFLRVGAVIAQKAKRKDAIAGELGVHPSMLSKMLTAERPWSYEQRMKMAEILGVHYESLFLDMTDDLMEIVTYTKETAGE